MLDKKIQSVKFLEVNVFKFYTGSSWKIILTIKQPKPVKEKSGISSLYFVTPYIQKHFVYLWTLQNLVNREFL